MKEQDYDNMEEVKVCRICLVMDVKMYDLQSHYINSYFISVAGSNLLKINNSPPYACYECIALVKKFYHFRQKCHKSQDLLNSLIDHNKKITVSKLKQIDRQALGLSSNLNAHFVSDSSIEHFLRPQIIVKKESSIDNVGSNCASLSSEIIVKDGPSAENTVIKAPVNPLVPEIDIKKEPVPENMLKEGPIVQNINSPILNNLINAPPSQMTIRKEPLIRNIRSSLTINSLAAEVIESIFLAQSMKPKIPAGNIIPNFRPNLNTEIIIKDEPTIESNKYSVNSEDGIEDEDYGSPDRCSSSEDDDDSMPLVTKEDAETQTKDNKDENDDVDMPGESQAAKRRTNRKSRRKLVDELVDDFIITKLTLQEQIEELNKRKTSSNYLRSPFKCEFCYKGFIDTTTWELHNREHSPSAGAIECPVCKIRFACQKIMDRHLARHGTKFACRYCSHISCDPSRAKYHQRHHKGIEYTCKHCGEAFIERIAYLRHAKTKHPPEFICDICGGSYISKMGLYRHKVIVHKDVMVKGGEIQEDGIYCEECDLNFNSMAAYERHAVGSSKHTRNLNECPTCFETFKDQEEMKIHYRKEHPEKPRGKKAPRPNLKWPTKCEHCAELLQNSRDHWYHYRRTHPDKKPVLKSYVCEICEKSFERNTTLQDHKRTHTGERPYSCRHCGKAFGKLFNLQVHEKSHSDLHPFVCHLCPKAFKFKYAINRHLAYHSGEKPFQCDICSTAFTTAGHRRDHVNTVHLGQPRRGRSRQTASEQNINTGCSTK